jgi:hypothetical protein
VKGAAAARFINKPPKRNIHTDKKTALRIEPFSTPAANTWKMVEDPECGFFITADMIPENQSGILCGTAAAIPPEKAPCKAEERHFAHEPVMYFFSPSSSMHAVPSRFLIVMILACEIFVNLVIRIFAL